MRVRGILALLLFPSYCVSMGVGQFRTLFLCRDTQDGGTELRAWPHKHRKKEVCCLPEASFLAAASPGAHTLLPSHSGAPPASGGACSVRKAVGGGGAGQEGAPISH